MNKILDILKTEQPDLLFGLDKKILEKDIKALIMCLAPFQFYIKMVEGEKQPTIQKVLQVYELCIRTAKTISEYGNPYGDPEDELVKNSLRQLPPEEESPRPPCEESLAELFFDSAEDEEEILATINAARGQSGVRRRLVERFTPTVTTRPGDRESDSDDPAYERYVTSTSDESSASDYEQDLAPPQKKKRRVEMPKLPEEGNGSAGDASTSGALEREAWTESLKKLGRTLLFNFHVSIRCLCYYPIYSVLE